MLTKKLALVSVVVAVLFAGCGDVKDLDGAPVLPDHDCDGPAETVYSTTNCPGDDAIGSQHFGTCTGGAGPIVGCMLHLRDGRDGNQPYDVACVAICVRQ